VRSLVNIVEDWENIEDQTKWCRYGIYQIHEELDGVEVRVRVGQFGYKKTFQSKDDKELNRILDFCKHEGFIKVLGTVPDEFFFSSE